MGLIMRIILSVIVSESPALEDDATEMDELFAERRGLATRRVALSKREGAGRRYRLVVDEKGRGDDRELLPLQR